MGLLECDDGNLLDGDGCNSFCEVEAGYLCEGGNEDTPDKCLDVLPPTAKIIRMLDNYTLYLEFNEEIIIYDEFTNCPIYYIYIYIVPGDYGVIKEYESRINISLLGPKTSYAKCSKPLFTLQHTEKYLTPFKFMSINILPDCNINGESTVRYIILNISYILIQSVEIEANSG